MEEKTCRAGELLWKTAEKLHRYLVRGYGSEGAKFPKTVSSREIVLDVIFSHPEGIMLKDIAREVNRSAGAVSQIIETLVQEKLVTRVVSRQDRRAIAIHPTPLGKTRRTEYFGRLNRAMSDILQTVCPQEREIFTRVLEKVAARFPPVL